MTGRCETHTHARMDGGAAFSLARLATDEPRQEEPGRERSVAGHGAGAETKIK